MNVGSSKIKIAKQTLKAWHFDAMLFCLNGFEKIEQENRRI